MSLKYFVLLITLIIVFFGLNLAGAGIAGMVGEGSWQVTTIEWNQGHLTLGIFEHKMTVPLVDFQGNLRQSFQEAYAGWKEIAYKSLQKGEDLITRLTAE